MKETPAPAATAVATAPASESAKTEMQPELSKKKKVAPAVSPRKKRAKKVPPTVSPRKRKTKGATQPLPPSLLSPSHTSLTHTRGFMASSSLRSAAVILYFFLFIFDVWVSFYRSYPLNLISISIFIAYHRTSCYCRYCKDDKSWTGSCQRGWTESRR